jgi:hypothetical protein
MILVSYNEYQHYIYIYIYGETLVEVYRTKKKKTLHLLMYLLLKNTFSD